MRTYLGFLFWGIVFLGLVFLFDDVLTPRFFQPRAQLPQLAWEHLVLTLGAFLLSLILVASLKFLEHRFPGPWINKLTENLSTMTETVPSVALIALLVPLVGYGNLPLFLALGTYGVFPLHTAWTGGRVAIAPEILENAKGLGFKPTQIFWRIEAPLAFPVFMAGVRTTLVNITAAATLGATVGAGGFGAPILAGIRSSDPLLILQGALPSAALALAFDSLGRGRKKPG